MADQEGWVTNSGKSRGKGRGRARGERGRGRSGTAGGQQVRRPGSGPGVPQSQGRPTEPSAWGPGMPSRSAGPSQPQPQPPNAWNRQQDTQPSGDSQWRLPPPLRDEGHEPVPPGGQRVPQQQVQAPVSFSMQYDICKWKIIFVNVPVLY
jgi:hypothetical protein